MPKDDETEYSARGNPSALPEGDYEPRAGEKLRLRYLTGQDEDVNAPRDPSHFYGGGFPTRRGARRSD